MTRQSRPASSRQEREPVGQPIEDLLGGEDSCSDSRELDRQRQTVETAAQPDDGRLVRGGQLERPRCGDRALGEQQDGLVLSQPGERFAPPAAGSASGGTGTTCSPGTWSGSRLVVITRTPGAARRTSVTRWAAASSTCSQLSSTSNSSRSRREDNRTGNGAVAAWSRRSSAAITALVTRAASRISASSTHQAPFAKPRPRSVASAESQARLADTSGADEADQAPAGQGPSKLSQLPAASHEARGLGGNVA